LQQLGNKLNETVTYMRQFAPISFRTLEDVVYIAGDAGYVAVRAQHLRVAPCLSATGLNCTSRRKELQAFTARATLLIADPAEKA
jgi:hypothetical protein